MEPIAAKPQQLVKITWEDSSYEKGWHYRSEDGDYQFGDPCRRIETVGYIVENRGDVLVISGSLSRTGGVLCPLFIPYGMIVEILALE